MKTRRAMLISLVMTMLVSLSGCSVPTGPTSPPSRSEAAPTATPTPPVSPAPTPVPPKPTPVPTLTPLATPAPTLTPEQEQALVLDLQQGNAGCRLPCWWSFTPGKTPWTAAEAFFLSIGKTPEPYRDPGMLNYTVKFRVPEHDVEMAQLYLVNDGLIDMIWVSAGTVRNHETIYGDPLFAQDLRSFMLPGLLASLGQPMEVLLLLRTWAPYPGGSVPYHLLLFYPRSGVLIEYRAPAEKEKEQFRVCPGMADITMLLWAPGREMTLEDVARTGLRVCETNWFHTPKSGHRS